MLTINAIVSINNGANYGVVTELFTIGNRKLAQVHKIDPSTGDKMVCPDKRCDGKTHTCPIHSSNVDQDELSPWSHRDIDFYVSEGSLTPALAAKAKAPVIKIEWPTGCNYFIVTATEEGWQIGREKITQKNHYAEWELARRLVVFTKATIGICANVTLSDNECEDYKTFAALMALCNV